MSFRYAAGSFILLSSPVTVLAGMPAMLPTPYTKDKFPHAKALDHWMDERLQALSFFLLVFVISALAVRMLWNLARKDWPQVPRLSYPRALLFTFIWGLVAIVVLTMISGARELMTPGAWRKQGWTYKLASATVDEPFFRQKRRAGLERLRLSLMSYAAMHEGKFPTTTEEVDVDWNIPAHPGFDFLYRPDHAPSTTGELLAFEPELGDEERFVLLTSGLIGTMRTAEIESALRKGESK